MKIHHKVTKSFLSGFINKKVVLIIFAIIVVILVGYGSARVFFNLRNSSKTQEQQNQATGTSTNKMINSTADKSMLVKPATIEQQCVICKSMIKAGAKSSCMVNLKCK